MEVTVKLLSSLMEYLPPDAKGNTVVLSECIPLSCNQVIEKLQIPPEQVRVVMVNGEFLPAESYGEGLAGGDSITIWPAIQGG
jgi:sulfur carrier protein ThiS